MNLTRAERFRLTAFLATGAVLVFSAIVILAGLQLFSRPDQYTVKFDESVAGLEEGSAVRYQGFRIGSVQRMEIDSEDPQLIRVTLAVDPEVVLYEGTEAVIDLSGLTGLRTVNLVPGDPRAGMIDEGSEIPSTPSFVGQLGDRAEEIAERVMVLTERIAQWTKTANRKRVERLLDHFDQLVVDTNHALKELEQPTKSGVEQATATLRAAEKLMNRSRLAMDRLEPETKALLVTYRKTAQRLHRLLEAIDEDEVRIIVKSVASASKNLDDILAPEQFGEVVAEAQLALRRMASILDDTDLLLRASREDFVLSLKEIREASEDLREFSRLIAQDPSLLIRGTEVTE
ncbi:MAG: MlaD family protein [Myxococcota bacterium]